MDNELLEYVVIEVLEGPGINEDPRDGAGKFADEEPEGEMFDEEVEQSYPRLAALQAPSEPKKGLGSRIFPFGKPKG